jgi:hypothetical protein
MKEVYSVCLREMTTSHIVRTDRGGKAWRRWRSRNKWTRRWIGGLWRSKQWWKGRRQNGLSGEVDEGELHLKLLKRWRWEISKLRTLVMKTLRTKKLMDHIFLCHSCWVEQCELGGSQGVICNTRVTKTLIKIINPWLNYITIANLNTEV